MPGEKGELVKIGALWADEDKDGNQYFSGSFGDAKLLVLPNQFKESSKHPDYVVFVCKRPRKPEDTATAPQRSDKPRNREDKGSW